MREIGLSEEPLGWDELDNGDSGFYYSGDNLIHTLKFDGTIYESVYGLATAEPEDIDDSFITEDGLSSGGVEWFSNNDAIGITDSSNVTRVLIGQVATGTYGMEISNAAGDAIAKFYGIVNELAGWNISTTSISKTDSGKTIELSSASSQPFFRVKDATHNFVTAGYINSTQVGLQIRDSAGVLTFSSLNDTATLIGGWTVGATTITGGNIILSQASSGSIRIGTSATGLFMDGAKDRFSVIASSNEKTAMGYLTGLPRNGASGTSDTSTNVLMTDASQDWETNQLVDLELKYTSGDASGEVRTITANAPTTITTAAFSPVPDDGDAFSVIYPDTRYGFWAASGDELSIDGDVQYESGDWIVHNDASLRIRNNTGAEVLRLGSRGTQKGLFLFDGTGTANSDVLAEYTSTGFAVGDVDGATERISYTTAAGLVINGTINVQDWGQIGSGINLVPAQYIAFEGSILPETYVISGVATLDPALSILPSGIGNTLVLTASGADCYCYLASSATAYNIDIEVDQKYILSFYTKDSVAGIVHDCYLVTNESGTHLSRNNSWTGTTTVQRVQLLFDLTSASHDASDAVVIRVDNDGGDGHISHFSGFMLEKSLGATGDNQASPLSFAGDLPLTYGTEIDAGGITFGTGGSIKGGQADFHDGVAGFFLGYSSAGSGETGHKFSVGDSTNYMTWDGTQFNLGGTMVIDGDDTAGALNLGVTIDAGGIELGLEAVLNSGQSAYNTGSGWWLGAENNGEFSIGDGGTNALTWDGGTLAVRGSLNADDLTVGSFSVGSGMSMDVEQGAGIASLSITNSDGETPLLTVSDGTYIRVKIGRLT